VDKNFFIHANTKVNCWLRNGGNAWRQWQCRQHLMQKVTRNSY